MVIRDKVKQEIDRMPEGVVVSASDFDIPRQYRATLIKALNQFEYAGIIKRISKGRYYKPRTSRFGELLPPEKEIVSQQTLSVVFQVVTILQRNAGMILKNVQQL